jgi:proline iminopeptidase
MALEVERYVNSAHARLWSTISGIDSGVPLVLFNGGPGCDDYLGPVARMLEDRCRVVRFEPRGCGRSERDGKYDFDTLLCDAEAIRQCYGFERWIVAGHSAGPNAALAYAIRYSKSTLGVLGISGGKVVDDRRWSELYHSRLESVGEDNGGQQFDADPDVNRQGVTTFREYCRRPQLLRELSTLAVPCVFVNASEDIRPNWPTKQLAELIPRARYLEIAGAAHYSWLTHPRQLQHELQSALDYILG